MVTITVRIQTSDCFMVRPKPLFHQVAPQLPVRIPKWSPLFSLKPWYRHQYWCLWSDTHSEPAAVLWIRWKMSWNSGKMPFSVKVPLKFTLQGLFNAPIKKIVNFYKAWVEKKKKKRKEEPVQLTLTSRQLCSCAALWHCLLRQYACSYANWLACLQSVKSFINKTFGLEQNKGERDPDETEVWAETLATAAVVAPPSVCVSIKDVNSVSVHSL